MGRRSRQRSRRRRSCCCPSPSSPLSTAVWERADEIAIAARADSLRERRCAWCHEDIGRALSRTCEGCGITLHAFCCREARRCPSLGCRRDWPRAPSIFARLRAEDLIMAIGGAYAVLGWLPTTLVSAILFKLLAEHITLPRYAIALWVLATALLFLASYAWLMPRVRAWAEARSRREHWPRLNPQDES